MSAAGDPGRGRPLLSDLRSHLTCVICAGYFIDATTIVECLHTFCRSCILRHLEASSYCPVCDVMIHRTKGASSLRADRIIQTMVYKLVPGLFREEMKQRREFYDMKPYADPELPGWAKGDVDAYAPHVYTADENVHVRLTLFADARGRVRPPDHRGPERTAEDAPPARYLRCPAGTPLPVLQKLVRAKFQLPPAVQVQVIYGDHVLPDDISLMDLCYMYRPSQGAPVDLAYRFVRKRPAATREQAESTAEPVAKRPRPDELELRQPSSDSEEVRQPRSDEEERKRPRSDEEERKRPRSDEEELKRSRSDEEQLRRLSIEEEMRRLSGEEEVMRPVVVLERMFDADDDEPTSPEIVEDIIASLDAEDGSGGGPAAGGSAAESAADSAGDAAGGSGPGRGVGLRASSGSEEDGGGDAVCVTPGPSNIASCAAVGATCEPTDGETCEPTGVETCESADSETREPVGGETCEPVGSETYEPVGGETCEPVGSETGEPVVGGTCELVSGEKCEPGDGETNSTETKEDREVTEEEAHSRGSATDVGNVADSAMASVTSHTAASVDTANDEGAPTFGDPLSGCDVVGTSEASCDTPSEDRVTAHNEEVTARDDTLPAGEVTAHEEFPDEGGAVTAGEVARSETAAASQDTVAASEVSSSEAAAVSREASAGAGKTAPEAAAVTSVDGAGDDREPAPDAERAEPPTAAGTSSGVSAAETSFRDAPAVGSRGAGPAGSAASRDAAPTLAGGAEPGADAGSPTVGPAGDGGGGGGGPAAPACREVPADVPGRAAAAASDAPGRSRTSVSCSTEDAEPRVLAPPPPPTKVDCSVQTVPTDRPKKRSRDKAVAPGERQVRNSGVGAESSPLVSRKCYGEGVEGFREKDRSLGSMNGIRAPSVSVSNGSSGIVSKFLQQNGFHGLPKAKTLLATLPHQRTTLTIPKKHNVNVLKIPNASIRNYVYQMTESRKAKHSSQRAPKPSPDSSSVQDGKPRGEQKQRVMGIPESKPSEKRPKLSSTGSPLDLSTHSGKTAAADSTSMLGKTSSSPAMKTHQPRREKPAKAQETQAVHSIVNSLSRSQHISLTPIPPKPAGAARDAQPSKPSPPSPHRSTSQASMPVCFPLGPGTLSPHNLYSSPLHVNTSMAGRMGYDMAMRNLLTLSHMAMAQGGMLGPPMFPMQPVFPARSKSQDFHQIPDPSLLRQQSEARMGAASKKASPTAGSTAPQLRTPTALTSASIQHMEDLTRTLGKKRPDKERHSVTVTAIPFKT